MKFCALKLLAQDFKFKLTEINHMHQLIQETNIYKLFEIFLFEFEAIPHQKYSISNLK